MATLRDGIQGTVIPLSVYVPGLPFPPVNPDELSADIKKEYLEKSAFWSCVFFLSGTRRSLAHRTLYNAARPFKVIGGVSDDELKWLSLARGPYAQMALCNMWLKEFISREHLHGSTGSLEAPIISRIFKFISDGVKGYVWFLGATDKNGLWWGRLVCVGMPRLVLIRLVPFPKLARTRYLLPNTMIDTIIHE
jgi:hypothetical protein